MRRWGFELTDETLWKLYGPDLSDSMGGVQGIGGLEAVWNETTNTGWALVNDSLGNLVAYSRFDHGTQAWVTDSLTTPVSSYGPVIVANYAKDAWATTAATDLMEATIWRGYRMDPTGLYWMGARYYDPQGGRFISPDPLGHSASEDLYPYLFLRKLFNNNLEQ